MFKFVLAALLVATTALAAPWPSFFEPCAVSASEFEQCAQRNIQEAMSRFSGGVADLELPPFDPMLVPEILLNYEQQGVSGNMIVRNSKATGLSGAKILSFQANVSDPQDLRVEVGFAIPHVFVEGEYKADGKIVAFPIQGKGVYNISLSDVTGKWVVRAYLVEVDGEKYMKARHVDMYPDVGDMKVYASNLFTGNDDLNKVALKFANDYWPVFYKELLPFAAEGWDQFLRGMLNKLLLKVPFRTLFPEN